MALRVDDVDLGRDRVLVERYQAGDHRAFDDLYSRYFRRLHRYCARRVHDFDTAEEIAQEAFVRALQALPRLDGDRRFYPWMTVIASRLCVDHHRRRQRTQPSDDVDPGVVDPDLDHVFTAVDHAHLATALERINPRHRRVLELREREGLSYEAIADRMEVTLGTVEALLHRARKALRREFLAVADDPRRLAGVPLVGALVRSVGRLRSRMAEATTLGQAIAVGAASVALVMAPAVIPAGSPSSDSPAAEVAATLAADRPPAHLGARTGTGGVSPDADATGAITSHEAEDGRADRARRVAAVSSPQISMGDPDGRHEVEQEPVSSQTGPVVVGVDPVEALAETAEEINDVLELAR